MRTESVTDEEYRSDASTVDLSGHCVGNSYLLLEPIGQGATGTVWRAVDRSTGGQVAVKLLREDLIRQPKVVTRFVQERAILLMLRHDHIVRVRDLLAVGESLGLVMDLVDGGSLRDHLLDRRTLPADEAAALLAQVAGALAEAHAFGVVHRDVKPDNILLDRGAGTLTSRLTDFGIARVLDAPGLTTSGALVGTPNYMAPEVINGGRTGPAADVYALGVLLYELVVGRQPYAGGPAVAVLRRHVDANPRRLPGIPDPVWSVITVCMAKDPVNRPSALELVTTLRSLARQTVGVPALAPPPADDHRPVTAIPSQPGPHGTADSAPGAARGRSGSDGGPGAGGWRSSRRWLRVGLAVLVAGGLFAPRVADLTGWRLLDAGRTPGPTTPSRGPERANGPAPTTPAAPTPSAVPGAAQAPTAASESGGADGAFTGPRVSASVAFGPWQCADEYRWDPGHPVLAKPCFATTGASKGGEVRVIGHMQALPGVQADVSLTIEDAVSGERLVGPYTCGGLMFTDFAPEHSCGPFDTAPARGHRCVVVEKWQYTGRGLFPGGTARGPEFSW